MPEPTCHDPGPTVDEVAHLVEDSPWDEAVRRLLGVVRTQLGMQTAWLSEFVGDAQVLRFVDSRPGVPGPAEGTSLPMSGSYCARVLDGRFPSLIPEARTVPEMALLDVTHALRIGAYVGVPLLGPAGTAVGMLCATDPDPCPRLTDRDLAALRLVADLLHDLQQRAIGEQHAAGERSRLRAELEEVIAGHGRHTVLQPVVDLADGRAVAAEGLTRFTATGRGRVCRSPAQWFSDAARLGLRTELELATAATVLDLLDAVPSGTSLTVNLGPATVLSPGLASLLAGRDLRRVVVEVTEHAPVDDYAALAAALAPYRDQGLQLAVDDAGAGYASLQHVLAVRPDLVKVDMTLVRGADEDPARRTLLTALAGFVASTGGRLVAEGVETAAELRAVADCGVHLAQGYFLARPSAEPAWSGYPTPV